MRTFGLVMGWAGLLLATLATVVPDHVLGGSRDLLIIRGYAFAAAFFAFAANCSKERR